MNSSCAHAPFRYSSLHLRVGRWLAVIAAIALLGLQGSLVWHALEHVSEHQALNQLELVNSDSDTLSTESSVCLKCVEDLAHSVGLVCALMTVAPGFAGVLVRHAIFSSPLSPPVVPANQRGPPFFLSEYRLAIPSGIDFVFNSRINKCLNFNTPRGLARLWALLRP